LLFNVVQERQTARRLLQAALLNRLGRETSTILTIIAKTLRRFLKVVDFQFRDRVHAVITQVRSRPGRAVV
jgi:hypothetical protein